jgi:3-deoxy-D-manno-octulosonic-acid transferase
VGEALLALKLIREWLKQEPERRFVLATGTATGHQVATAAAIANVRVTYSPLDFRFMVRRYLNRFEPEQMVLIEGEAWPHLLLACRKRGIPVSLVNARMSPRSAAAFLDARRRGHSGSG